MSARSSRLLRTIGLGLIAGASGAILWFEVRPAVGFGADLGVATLGLAVLYVPALAIAWAIGFRFGLQPLDVLVITGLVGLGAIVIGGFVLSALPFGLARASWLGLGVAMLLVAVAVAGRLPSIRLRPLHGGPGLRDVAMLGAAALLVATGLAIARTGVQPTAESFSSLWIHRTLGGSAEIGVENHEGTTSTYRVDVLVDGQLAARYPAVKIDAGQQWTAVVPVSIVIGSQMQVLLYDAARGTAPYRSVAIMGPLSAPSVAPSAGT
ncbi:MAG TPA: hypothetical protein VET90_02415 [Candidatus Binatus sp.]|nr:hypothetical protein [Candidatus Binatus sp.]